MTPTLSIIHCTYRPGGLKILADTLAAQTDRDFELFVVDDCPERPQATYEYLLKRLANAHDGTRYLYEHTPYLRFCGPSKPQPLRDAKVGIANARNTVLSAIVHVALTSHILFVDDYLWLPPTAVADWKRAIAAAAPRTIITGVGRVYAASRPPDNFIAPDQLDPIHAWKDPQPTMKWKWDWVPGEYEGYNAMPVEFFRQTNGMDERADCCTCFIPQSIVAQGKLMGYRFVVDKSLVCRIIDHRSWHAGANEEDGPWRINAYSSVPEEPAWAVPSVRSDA